MTDTALPPASSRACLDKPIGVANADPDRVVVGLLLIGLLGLAVPIFWNGSEGRLNDGIRGHEPAIFAVSAFLLHRARHGLRDLPAALSGSRAAGALLFVLGLVMFMAGQAFDLRLSMMALVVIVASALLRWRGPAGVRRVWFALAFPIFALPLPLEFVLALTGPLKTAVSSVATALLSSIGYPVGRSGVVMTIGQYQLLVTEACAGLQTMFTLEAMGLLYASLVNHASPLRNGLLAVLVVPIAFIANVVRVIVLALITYHFGNDAGQGFLHEFSGLVLFAVALVLVVAVDGLIGRALARKGRP